jgi:DNA-damage-inducible protein D
MIDRELIAAMFSKFELAKQPINNLECWSARELQLNLGYSDWRNFVYTDGQATLQ